MTAATELRRNWGFFVFVLGSLVSLAIVAKNPVGSHYQIFVAGARLLLAGQNPFTLEPLGASGWWFYSPSCGLFYFSIFSIFPDRVGQFLFILSAVMLFTWGVQLLVEKFESRSFRNIFWLFLSSEMIGAILNTRVELFMVGAVLVSADWLWRSSQSRWKFWGASLLLTMVTVWKLLTLPVLGLLTAVTLVKDRSLRFFTAVLASTGFWILSPFFVKPFSYVTSTYAEWLASMHRLVGSSQLGDAANWTNYQHIYRFAMKMFGFSLTYNQAQVIGAITGFALLVWLVSFALREKRLGHDDFYCLLWALAFGSLHQNVFMPTAQSAAYVSYAPLLFGALLLWSRAQGKWRYILLATNLFSYFFVSLAYSDFVPKSFRAVIWTGAYKPMGCLVLGLVCLTYLWLHPRPKSEKLLSNTNNVS